MPGQKVLVIEDDAAIRRGIVDSLRFHGYAVKELDGRKGTLEGALAADCDLLLLDLVLPDADGFRILDAVKQHAPTLPVIILTARGEESDRVRGLKSGADDYVVKPFSVKELLARVEAVLRRSPERPRPVETVRFDGGEADLGAGEIRFTDGGVEKLSETESQLLRYLSMHAGRTVSREEILSRVWKMPAGVETRTVDMHVVRLREKLRDDPAKPRIILTERGKGYRMAPL
ncbi:MAG: response regulator transcription factor [Acidobacteria bacterium]|nr:response regulator transcription factor [Acidobacteriota bacterium]